MDQKRNVYLYQLLLYFEVNQYSLCLLWDFDDSLSLHCVKARLLKKANIHVEEDLSKRTRENRAELRKFMRQVRQLASR